jgi:hypothetical protein
VGGVKTPEERGPVGAWAYDERDRRDWSVEEAVDQLRSSGVQISASYLRAIESGNKPASSRVRRGLEALYGSAPVIHVAAPNDMQELVTALHAQTDAINRVVDLLERQAGDDPSARYAGFVTALASQLGPLIDERLADRLGGEQR